jgi:membrane protease YdiL (CAAX protease family)
MKKFIATYPVLVFVLLTLGYQFAVVGMVKWMVPEWAHLHDSRNAWMIFRMRVFGPLAFAVLLTVYLEGVGGLKKLFGSFLHWRVPAKWYLLAFSWKFMFTYIGIAFIVVLGIAPWPGFLVDNFILGTGEASVAWVKNLPFIVGIAFVEETSWLKFGLTRLQERYKALPACLIMGMAWGLWYLPMLLIHEGVPDGYPWPVFLVSMICLTILLGWTYNMTRSGTILLIMQIMSNCAFFIIPVLPAWWGGDATYVTGFVSVNLLSAVTLVLVFGWRELGTRTRAKWSDDAVEEDALIEPEQARDRSVLAYARNRTRPS